MAKKISAKIKAPGCDEYRAYFQEVEREDGTRQVLVWTAKCSVGFFNTDRFNGGVFSRDWVRSMYGNRAEVSF